MNEPIVIAAIGVFIATSVVNKNPSLCTFAASWFITKVSTLGALFVSSETSSFEETSNKDN